jgi:hypothetical protein
VGFTLLRSFIRSLIGLDTLLEGIGRIEKGEKGLAINATMVNILTGTHGHSENSSSYFSGSDQSVRLKLEGVVAKALGFQECDPIASW